MFLLHDSSNYHELMLMCFFFPVKAVFLRNFLSVVGTAAILVPATPA